MKPRAYIILGTVAVLLLVALFTVLNKVWWAKRVFAKWKITSNLAKNKELMKNTSLARMIEIYRYGMDGWELRTSTGTTNYAASGVELQDGPQEQPNPVQ